MFSWENEPRIIGKGTLSDPSSEIRIIQEKSVLVQHLGDQYCYVTSMCNIIAFYATSKQVLILLMIWLDLGFISSVQMRPSVGFFNNTLSI